MSDKKRLVVFLITIVLIAALSFGLCYAYEKGWFGKNGNTPVEPSNNVEEKVYKFSGVYKNNNNIVITLYELENKTVHFTINKEDELSASNSEGDAKISGDTAKGDIFNHYTFVVKENGIEFTTSDENYDSGLYTKTGEYTKNEYYRDKYGDASLINSEYNGQYELDGATIYMYQSEKDKVRVVAEKGLSSSDLPYDINDDKTLHATIFDDEYTIKLEENSLIFTTIKGDKTFDGTYKKTKTLTMDDIIKNISA